MQNPKRINFKNIENRIKIVSLFFFSVKIKIIKMGKHIRFDWAIKRLLRQKANFGILEGFLSELLMEDIFIMEIIESETNKQREKDKFNRIDILVKNSKEELMLVEVQNERQHDYFHRMNYGQAKLTSEYISSGDSYDKIKKVYSINIVYFELGQGKDYIYVGTTNFKINSFRILHQNLIFYLFNINFAIIIKNILIVRKIKQKSYEKNNIHINFNFYCFGCTFAKSKSKLNKMETNKFGTYTNNFSARN